MEKDTIVIGGEISLALDAVDGETILLNEADGSPGAFYPIIPETYTGQMEFTPSMETQIAEVKGLFVTDNITINPIPQNYGLITWDGVEFSIHIM